MGGWSNYSMQRLNLEAGVLSKNHSHFEFQILWTRAIAHFWYRQSERWFRVRMEVPTTYPDEKPVLYVEQPKPLLDAFGQDLKNNAPSHNWHMLIPSSTGEVQICHFPTWDELKSLHLVVLKAKLWLDAYCWHLRSLQPICGFFKDCRD